MGLPWTAPERAVRGTAWTLEVAVASDRGRQRPRSEDAYAYYVPDDPGRRAVYGSLLCVADGVGGYEAGEAASAEAANVLLQEYYFSPARQRPAARLERAFRTVAAHLYALAHAHRGLQRMQTTLTALLLHGDRYYVAHVGDAKCYRLRDGAVRQLTRDHSLAAQMRRLGMLSEEEARRHPGRHVLTRSVGADPLVRPDLARGTLSAGDCFVLATDGAMDGLCPDDLVALFGARRLEEAVEEAVAAANRRGGMDNVTVVAVRVVGAMAESGAGR